ncbi:S-layer homology domain-containing protein, partial [Peptoniphilus sp. MSJ-1]
WSVDVPADKELTEGAEVKAKAQEDGKKASDEAKATVAKAEGKTYKTKWVQITQDGRTIQLKEEDGNKPDNDGVSDIPGYEFVRTDTVEVDNTVTITNIYKLQMASKSTGLDGTLLLRVALGYDKENPATEDGYTFLFDESSSTPEEVEGKQAYIINRIYAKNPEVVEVADPNNLTETEQKAVKDAVKKANKDLNDNQVAVSDKGIVTIIRGDKSATLDSSLTIKAKEDTTAPAAPKVVANDDGTVTITPPTDEDTEILMITYTDSKGVEGTVAATKGENGEWTLPEGSELTINPQTGVVTIPAGIAKPETEVKSTAQDKAGNASEEAKAIVATADKKVKKPEIKDVYTDSIDVEGIGEPGATVIVKFPSGRQARTGTDQNGKWRASLPDGEVLEEGAIIIVVAEKAGKETSEQASTTVKVKQTQTIEVKEPSKTEVKDPSALTEDEKQKVKDEVKKANEDLGLTDNDIEVKDDGSVVVTKDGKTGSLTPDKTIETSTKLEVKEPSKTEVKDPSALTEDEKQKVKDEVKKANEDLGLTDNDIEVKDDGSVVVTKDGKTGELAPEKTVETSTKLEVKEPSKTEVKDPSALTEDEKQKVKDEVKKANEDLGLTDNDIEVKDDGSVAVTKDGKTGELTPDKTVTAKASDGLNKPRLTEVENKNELTSYEKEKVREAVKASNPQLTEDAQIIVYDNGSVRVIDGNDEYTLEQYETVYEKRESFEEDPFAYLVNNDKKSDWAFVNAVANTSLDKKEEVVAKPVEEIKEHKAYIFGYEDGTVKPNRSVTRAEAAAMVARLMNYDLTDNSKPNFSDTNSWYNNVINAVVKAGIMKGYEDGTFKPDAPITRAEFAQLIKNIDKANKGEPTFTDVNKKYWAYEAIAQAFANGRISGYPDNTFRPDKAITRAEAAKILNSIFDRKVDEEGMSVIRDSIKKFIDLNKNQWYYNDMIEATNSHDFARNENQINESWKNLK